MSTVGRLRDTLEFRPHPRIKESPLGRHHRIDRVACMRLHHENVQAHAMMVFADTRDMHLLPKVRAAWMPQGTQGEVLTPGKHEKHSLAGALHLATGKRSHGFGPRTNHGLLRDLLTLLDR